MVSKHLWAKDFVTIQRGQQRGKLSSLGQYTFQPIIKLSSTWQHTIQPIFKLSSPGQQNSHSLHLGNKTHCSINIYKFFTCSKLNFSTHTLYIHTYIYIYILPLRDQSNHVEHKMILISFIQSTAQVKILHYLLVS